MPISGLTALGALDAAGVTVGRTCSSWVRREVGTYAVQIAVALGATVTGVARAPRLIW